MIFIDNITDIFTSIGFMVCIYFLGQWFYHYKTVQIHRKQIMDIYNNAIDAGAHPEHARYILYGRNVTQSAEIFHELMRLLDIDTDLSNVLKKYEYTYWDGDENKIPALKPRHSNELNDMLLELKTLVKK